MATILAKMIYHFDMQLVDPAQDWRKQKVYIVWEKKPLMVKLTARDVVFDRFDAEGGTSGATQV